MKNNIFFKVLLTGALIIIVSFSILAATLLALTVNYTVDERTQIMSAFGNSLSELGSLVTGPFVSSESLTAFQLQLGVISSSLDANVLVVASDGQPVIRAGNFKAVAGETETIDAAVMDKVMRQGQFYSTDTLGGYYSRQFFNIGTALKSRSGSVIGAIFISSDPVKYTGLIKQMGQIMTFSFFAVLVFSMGLVFLASKIMTRPIRQISRAASAFAAGDYSARVDYAGGGEIGEMTKSFNEMADSIERLEEMRTGFIANVSHDLRTPMTTISGFVDGVLDGTIAKEDQTHYLEIVSSEAKRLSRLVKTLLDVSRLDSGEYELNKSEFDIGELLRRTALSFLTRTEEKNLRLDMSLPEKELYVTGDSDALTRVFYNLLDNAVKFTPENGDVRVSLLESGPICQVRVRNSAGISEQQRKNIFERFYKADGSRGLDKSGLGLGLYIAKSIVERHQGTIAASSDGATYTEFCVTLRKK